MTDGLITRGMLIIGMYGILLLLVYCSFTPRGESEFEPCKPTQPSKFIFSLRGHLATDCSSLVASEKF